MSIRFLPYTSKYNHTGMKIYHPSGCSGGIGILGIAYRTSNNATQLEQIIVPINSDEWGQLHGLILDADDGFQHERKRKYILQDFANIIQGITKHFTASIWKTIKACPLLTIHELLWLKVDDIDSRVDHVEKMQMHLTQLLEDNHKLQCKINVLEKSQAKNNIENSKLIEENKLLQCKMEVLERSQVQLQCKMECIEKLVVQRMNIRKELLYELD